MSEREVRFPLGDMLSVTDHTQQRKDDLAAAIFGHSDSDLSSDEDGMS